MCVWGFGAFACSLMKAERRQRSGEGLGYSFAAFALFTMWRMVFAIYFLAYVLSLFVFIYFYCHMHTGVCHISLFWCNENNSLSRRC